MNDIQTFHEKEYGCKPEVVVSAPGTANLLGEYTDFNDGVTLEIAVDRFLTVAMSRRSDSALRFYSANYNERKRTTIPNLKYKREDRWANYPKGAVYELMQLGYSISGVDMTILSTIPEGIGLGSSAALTVATSCGVSELFSIHLSEFQIMQSAAMAESAFMGIDTSLSDHLTSTVSTQDGVVYIDLRTLKYENLAYDPEGVVLLITNSNVPRVSPGQEYRDRKEKCAEGLAYLKRRRPGRGIRDYGLADLKSSMGMVREDIRRLCTHVLQETERVIEAKKLIPAGDWGAVGKIMNRSHESLRDNYEVSCPEIDWLVKRAWEVEGMYGSRMIGPGFGGCTLSLIQEHSVDEYIERLGEYERIFGFTAETFVVHTTDGVRSRSSVVQSAK